MAAKTRTVYRVESTRGAMPGTGPYNTTIPDRETLARFALLEAMDRANCRTYREDRHPTPWDDPGCDGIEDGELCGFRSLRQARQWFSGGALRVLCERSDGFWALHRLEVRADTIRYGTAQVVFPEDAIVTKEVVK